MLSAMKMRTEGTEQSLKIIDQIRKNFFDLKETYNFSSTRLEFEDLAHLAEDPPSPGAMQLEKETVDYNTQPGVVEKKSEYAYRTFNQYINSKDLDSVYSTSNDFNLFQ